MRNIDRNTIKLIGIIKELNGRKTFHPNGQKCFLIFLIIFYLMQRSEHDELKKERESA